MQSILETMTAIFIIYYIITILITLGVKLEYSDKKSKEHSPITYVEIIFSFVILPMMLGMLIGEKDKKSRGIK